MSVNSEYLVLCWKTDPVKGAVLVFENPKSSDPGSDAKRALALGSSFVTVDVCKGQDIERVKRQLIERTAGHGIHDSTGRYFDPPLKDGVLTYNVHGHIPSGKFDKLEKDRALYKEAFRADVSTNPRRDVERALRFGCTRVLIGVNYEPSIYEKMDWEEQERQEEEWSRRKEWPLEKRPRMPVAYFSNDQFAKAKESGLIHELDRFKSYEEWQKSHMENVQEMVERGYRVAVVEIDVDEFLEWRKALTRPMKWGLATYTAAQMRNGRKILKWHSYNEAA
jgi:hypothetical protein